MAQRRRGRRRRTPQSDAFLNVPYDARYEDLYLAFLAGLCGFGLTPRATLEIPGGERRLERIIRLVRRCRYSFHDLSRVELDRRPPATPRFNMPFELGLAVGLARLQAASHKFFVFEAMRHRLAKSLSDMNGTDPHVHGGNPRRLLNELANALVRERPRPTVQQLERIYRDLKLAAPVIRRTLRARSLFEARAFADLVIAAQASARQRLVVPRA
jgi:hypothetical protein